MATTKPLSGNDLTPGSTGFTLADLAFLRNCIQNQNSASSTYSITAAGTTQATATQLASVYNEISTVAASTGVNLPYSGGRHNTAYQLCIIAHNGASDLKVYAAQNQTDTINGTAGATGITMTANTNAIFFSPKVGIWESVGGGSASNFGAITVTSISDSGNLTYTAAASGTIFKQGANGRIGQFTLTGTTAVTVSNTSVTTTDIIVSSLSVVGGTVGAVPSIKTITAATGFTVAGTVGDTSTYNYVVFSSAA